MAVAMHSNWILLLCNSLHRLAALHLGSMLLQCKLLHNSMLPRCKAASLNTAGCLLISKVSTKKLPQQVLFSNSDKPIIGATGL